VGTRQVVGLVNDDDRAVQAHAERLARLLRSRAPARRVSTPPLTCGLQRRARAALAVFPVAVLPAG